MTQYRQTRTCAACAREESRQLPAELAAFVERSHWSAPCQHCGSETFSAIGTSRPPLDRELLNEWSSHSDLSFSVEDEDLIMADAEALPLLQEFVQRRDIPETKRAILLSALCVIVYENTFDPADPSADIDEEIATAVIEFLKEHIWLFDEIDTDYLWPYIVEDVYPQIGLTPKKVT